MKIVIRCSGCKQDLNIKDSQVLIDDLVIYVEICQDGACYDCTNCEDLDTLRRERDELKERERRITELLKENDDDD